MDILQTLVKQWDACTYNANGMDSQIQDFEAALLKTVWLTAILTVSHINIAIYITVYCIDFSAYFGYQSCI